jgi:hypothetical protein
MTLNETLEPQRRGSTHVISLECSSAEPHDPLPQSELLNLWAALWG